MSFRLSFSLSDEFIAGFVDREVPWGFPAGGGNSLGEITFLTKYSRRKEDGSKERWFETCRRVVEGYYSILKDHCKQNRTPWNEFKAQKAAEDAYERLFTFKWTPPGRGLWMMGTEMVNGRRNSAALQNCFAGDELFITAEYGPVSFASMVGETVHVATPKGFREGNVQAFGVQLVQRVTFAPAMPTPTGQGYKKSRSNVRTDVQVTCDHRWILADGTETTDLKVGDTVRGLSPRVVNSEYWDAYVHGLIFGDGVKITHRYANGDYGYELRACDQRTKDIVMAGPDNEIVKRFDQISLTRASANGDPICSKRSSVDMKEFPRNVSASYLAGFLEGWIMADAALGVGTILTSQHPDAQDWLEKHSASAGYVLTGINIDSVMETNYGPRKNPSKRFTLREGSKTFWKVTAIELLDEQPVYCAVVPETGSFTLAKGIHTGNCAFLSTEKLSAHSASEATLPFVRLMEMSMLGVGVGFDTKGAGNLLIHEPNRAYSDLCVIDDSREGWVNSVGVLLQSYFFKNREVVEFDYSLIRPAGEPIRTFGGIAAGPAPLMELHESIRDQFSGRAGERISSTDIVDLMNKIGKCVISGNVRRSAEIALGSLDDDNFLNLKNVDVNPVRMGENGWGYTSNNSVVVGVGDDLSKIVDRIAENGEPGLVYLDLCRQYGRLIDAPNNRDYRVAGTNPCSFSGETIVHTVNGPRRIDSLEGESFWAVLNGKAHLSPGGSWVTGVDDIYVLSTREGYTVNLTGNHKVMTASGEWRKAEDLVRGDKIQINNHRGVPAFPGKGCWDEGYLLGAFIADGGWENVPVVKVWDKDKGSDAIADVITEASKVLSRRSDWSGWRDHGRGYRVMSLPASFVNEYGLVDTEHKFVNEFCELTSSDFHAGFLRAFFDADGHVEGWKETDDYKGCSVRLGQSNRDSLEAIQRMLLRFGIKSRVYLAKEAGEAVLPDGKGGQAFYPTKTSWRLVISSDDVKVFAERIGFSHEEKDAKLAKVLAFRTFYSKPFVATVDDLQFLRRDNVWDLTVSEVHAFDANGLHVSNSEQSLESFEMCTLVETFPVHHSSVDDFCKTLKHAYLYGKAVTLLPTHWAETNEIMQRNRRIGCSMSGVAQFVEGRSWTELRTWMSAGYDAIKSRDVQYSEWLGVRESVKMTSIKPSGTVSLLAGVTPGVHWPTNTIYIRRLRLAVTDPLLDVLCEAGYVTEKDVMDPKNTVCVEIPVVGPDVRTEREVSLWEKADLAVVAQRYWADNQVSVTITFDEKEKDQIGRLLDTKEGQLKSISLLPLSDVGAYKQMPYEAISREKYDQRVAKVQPMNMDVLYGGSALDAEGEKFCANDVCLL